MSTDKREFPVETIEAILDLLDDDPNIALATLIFAMGGLLGEYSASERAVCEGIAAVNRTLPEVAFWHYDHENGTDEEPKATAT